MRFYSVGLQLFLAGGLPIVEAILARGHRVMVDLKLSDIPETVALAVRELRIGVPPFSSPCTVTTPSYVLPFRNAVIPGFCR